MTEISRQDRIKIFVDDLLVKTASLPYDEERQKIVEQLDAAGKSQQNLEDFLSEDSPDWLLRYFSHQYHQVFNPAFSSLERIRIAKARQYKVAQLVEGLIKNDEDSERSILTGMAIFLIKQGVHDEVFEQMFILDGDIEPTTSIFCDYEEDQCGSLKPAMDYFELKAKDDPGRPNYYLAAMYEHLLKDGEALCYYEKAAVAGLHRARVRLAELYKRRGRFKEALDLLDQGIQAGDKRSYMHKGNILVNAGQIDEALEQYKLAYEAGNTDALFYLGDLNQKLAKFQGDDPKLLAEAANFYRLGLEKGIFKCLLRLGVVLGLLQEYQEAAVHLKRAFLQGANEAYLPLIYVLGHIAFFDDRQRLDELHYLINQGEARGLVTPEIETILAQAGFRSFVIEIPESDDPSNLN